MAPALSRHSSNSLEDVFDVCLHGFHVILRRYMVRVTETKNKDTRKETNKGWCGVTESRPKILGVVERRGDYVNHSRKKEGDMNLEKIYVCACIWITEINYLENKNGHVLVQLGWNVHVCNWERGGDLG